MPRSWRLATALRSGGADLEPPGTLVLRVSGDEAMLDVPPPGSAPPRAGPSNPAGAEEEGYWQGLRYFASAPPESWIVKVPLTLRRLPDLERVLGAGVPRRYTVAGNVAWLAWPVDRPRTELDLAGLNGLFVRGPALDGASPWIGPEKVGAAIFARRVKDALDPDGRFPPLVPDVRAVSAAAS